MTKTAEEIAKLLHRTASSVRSQAHLLGLRKPKLPTRTRKTLQELYVEKKMNIREVAKFSGVPNTRMLGLLVKYGLKRSRSEARKLYYKKHPNALKALSSRWTIEERRRNGERSRQWWAEHPEEKRRNRERLQYHLRKPEVRRKIALAKMGDKNPAKRPEVRKKLSKAATGRSSPMKGKKPSVEHLKNIRKAARGLKRRKKISQALKGRSSPLKGTKFTKQHKQRIGKSLRKYYEENEHPAAGKPFSKEHKRKISKAIKEYLSDEDNLDEFWHRFTIRPTKPEKHLEKLLNNILPSEYRYVGDGTFTLGRYCPDFLNVNGKKKIIELFGDYWHRNDNPQERIDYFKQFGFSTLIIWEHELRNKKKIANKIIAFNSTINVTRR